MDGWVEGCLHGWMDGLEKCLYDMMNGCVLGWLAGWKVFCMHGWMDGGLLGWIDR